MFWKKAKKIEARLYSYEDNPDNRREYIRVSPLPEAPVFIDFEGQQAELIDISAGGMACRGLSLEPTTILDLRFNLPGEKQLVEARVRVTAVSGNDIVHCAFQNLSAIMADTIHHYVLNVQKEKLRRAKEKS